MEEELRIRDLKKNSSPAFKELVEQYQDRVFNTCLGFLKQREDAEDLAQEVFLEVYRSLDSFRGEAELGTWIYRIAVTKSLELLRRRKRQKRWAYFLSLGGKEDPDDQEDPSGFAHPGLALENRELAGILMRAIEKLPESQRVAFTLHKMEHLSYREIAGVMETSVSAVESLMFRARRRLRELLKDYYEDQT